MRSFFAVLAILFLLWMIFTWVRWDSKERTAAASRRQIRDRLIDSTLAAKVKSVNAHPTVPIKEQGENEALDNELQLGAIDVDDELDADQIEAEDSRSSSENSSVEKTVERLREKLKQAEAAVSSAQQNDLELRRLRSELQSVEAKHTDAITRILMLEDRIAEQQAELEVATQAKGLNTDISKVQQNLIEQEKQNEDLRKRLSEMMGSEKKTTGQAKDAFVRPDKELASDVDASDVYASEPDLQSSNSSSEKSDDLTPLFEAPSYKDDLKLIKGIGPVMETTLNDLGVTTFQQLANFTQVDIDKVTEAIGSFPGRIERDDWVGKAKAFVDERSTS